MTRGDVLIVGGGASGTLLAAQLLRRARGPLRVLWVDRTGRFSRGLAYGAAEPWHLLNVPARNMSGLPEEPGHLLAWLEREGLPLGADDFLPRTLYGRYLEALLREAQGMAAPGVTLRPLQAEVVRLREVREEVVAELRSGETLHARVAVLASGNSEPGALRVPGWEACAGPRRVRSPWDAAALDALPRTGDVLLLGTGLTMADVVLSLQARGHVGVLHALSRHGLLPRTHVVGSRPRPLHLPPAEGLRGLVRAFREELARPDVEDWRSVLDGLRPHTSTLWQALTPADRRRFLRHLRAYWEVHRHRLPPAVAATLEALQREGRLQVHAGRLVQLAPEGEGLRVTWRPRGARATRTLHVHALVNCTGPALELGRLDSPLLGRMAEEGLVRSDPLGLGAETRGGALVGASGTPSTRLYTLGPLRRAELWESTAIPEIRVQAQALARDLCLQLEGPPPEEAPGVPR